MVSFSRPSLSALSTAVLGVVSVLAAPGIPMTYGKHAAHRVRENFPGFNVTTFFPKSTYKTFGAGIGLSHSKRIKTFSVGELAIAFVKSELRLSDVDIEYKSSFNSDTTKHAYFSQSINGVRVANAVANVAFNNVDEVVAFGSNFVKPVSAPSTTPAISSADAIAKAESILSATYNNFPTSLEFLAKDDESLVLTHVVQVRKHGHWYEAFIDAHSGELVSVHDFVAHASYKVVPIQQQSPLNGNFSTLTNPQDPNASPFGWHSDGVSALTDTRGNNVFTYKNEETSQQTSPGLNFIYDSNPSVGPATASNVDVARVNAFYVANSIHDITYLYGFTESAFNFQISNFNKGGLGHDQVAIFIQDPSTPNNAQFGTPPDGQSGYMSLGIFNSAALGRDSALDNTVVAHEYLHGVTNRMTGGGTGRCLQLLEAQGLGEGWSDAFADWMGYTSSAIRDFPAGVYVSNNPRGIRTYPYSTSKSVNPLSYQSLQQLDEEHHIGEVWANILHNVYAALVSVRGFSTTAKTDPTGTTGNVVFLHLFIDALAIQPCNPTLPSARDAWIQADVNRYGGANKCTLWEAFASRGLGVNAANYIDDGKVPAGC